MMVDFPSVDDLSLASFCNYQKGYEILPWATKELVFTQQLSKTPWRLATTRHSKDVVAKGTTEPGRFSYPAHESWMDADVRAKPRRILERSGQAHAGLWCLANTHSTSRAVGASELAPAT